MYFEENPDAKEKLNDEYRPVVKPIKIEPSPPSFIDPKMMQLSMNHYEKNNLYQFLKTNIGRLAASELMQRYNVGSSKHWTGATVFWQVDISGRIRTGKVIESVMPSSQLNLCCPLLFLPPIPPRIRVFSNESTLHMR